MTRSASLGRALFKNRVSWTLGSRQIGASLIASRSNDSAPVHRRYPHDAAATHRATAAPIILDNIRRFEHGLSLLQHPIDGAQGC
jgi:hypothetical protein